MKFLSYWAQSQHSVITSNKPHGNCLGKSEPSQMVTSPCLGPTQQLRKGQRQGKKCIPTSGSVLRSLFSYWIADILIKTKQTNKKYCLKMYFFLILNLLITFGASRFPFCCDCITLCYLIRAAIPKPIHPTRAFWHFILRPELLACYPSTSRPGKAAKEIVLPFPPWFANLQVFLITKTKLQTPYVTHSSYLCSCNTRCWMASEAALEILNVAKQSATPLTDSFLTNKKYKSNGFWTWLANIQGCESIEVIENEFQSSLQI